MNTKIILLAIFGMLISCSGKEEKIILTTGLSSDPSELRFGIELNRKKVFYCEEIAPMSGKYEYYSGNFDPEKFDLLKREVEKIFDSLDTNPVTDGKPYELTILFDGSVKTARFGWIQYQCVLDIINVKNGPMDEIEYHEFPRRLLEEKLPVFIPPSELESDSLEK
jgi:hypothetical protein